MQTPSLFGSVESYYGFGKACLAHVTVDFSIDSEKVRLPFKAVFLDDRTLSFSLTQCVFFPDLKCPH